MYVHLHMSLYMHLCIPTQSSSILWWIQRRPHLLPVVSSLSVHLIAVLLLLLLELPEMGLDGGGGLLNFDGAEWRNSGHGARPIAGIGVWARQDTGYSQRGRGNSHGDIVCSNDWVQTHGAHISLDSHELVFWSTFSGFDLTLDLNQTFLVTLRQQLRAEKEPAFKLITILTPFIHPYAVPPEPIKLQIEHNSSVLENSLTLTKNKQTGRISWTSEILVR